MITKIVRGSLEVIHVENRYAHSEITPLGAHVLSYTPNGAQDLLWVSDRSNFEPGKAIRGGIPVCWPWFGPAAKPNHGTARITLWEGPRVTEEADGSTTVVFTLSAAEYALELELAINVGPALTLALKTRNAGERTYHLTEALHTYLAVTDITRCAISGLDGADYLDKVSGERGVRHGDITFAAETDCIYDRTAAVLVLSDLAAGRGIRVERTGSHATVVWNPWIAKARAMADFGDEEYRTMVCLEAANIERDAIELAPGACHTLGTRISLL